MHLNLYKLEMKLKNTKIQSIIKEGDKKRIRNSASPNGETQEHLQNKSE